MKYLIITKIQIQNSSKLFYRLQLIELNNYLENELMEIAGF